MRAVLATLLFTRMAAAQAIDPDEHGHGHRHEHPHRPDPHHHHPHEHPHPPGVGHHHPFVVEPVVPPGPPAAAPAPPPPPPPPAPPELRDFHPRRGPPGMRVTLSGVRFADDARVLYNGRALETHVEGHSILVVHLPPRATSDVFVLRQRGAPEVRSAESFIVEPAPVIDALSPAAAPPGAAVEIRGRNFLAGDRVLFGERPAQILSTATERIEVVVPEGAQDCRPAVVREESLGRWSRTFRVLVPQPVVTAVQPSSGAPGTTVRIVGRNFLPGDRATLGKTSMPVLARGPEFLDATVPAGARSGEIRVTGAGRLARAETEFTVIYPPVPTGFEPVWAAPGTRVVLHGKNFVAGDGVVVGDRPAHDLHVDAGEISFVVPDDAQSAPVAVVRGNLRAATRATLEVVRPPRILSFQPEGGPGGTRVVLRGENLSQDAHVRYGASELRAAMRNPGEIEVQVPRGAADERFTITTRGGEAQSDKMFIVWEPAAVTTFEPAFGAAGTQVVIHGSRFTEADTVSLAGQDLPVQSASPDALTVVVPPGARPAPFVVRSRGQDLATRRSFRVVAPPPPLTLQFAPLSGAPGTEVALRTGRRFTTADRVLLGGSPLLKTLAADGAEARVRIPKGAHTGRFEVEMAGGGRVVADQPFQVVENVAPAADAPGVY